MGVHICIYDKEGNEHPTWDSYRQGDDRENAEALSQDNVQHHSGKSFYEDPYFLLRPTETTVLVGDRGKEMTEILSDHKWWVYLSY